MDAAQKSKKYSHKLNKLVKIHCAEAFSLGTFITRMSSFDLKLIQNKLKFYSAKVILLNEVSHV